MFAQSIGVPPEPESIIETRALPPYNPLRPKMITPLPFYAKNPPPPKKIYRYQTIKGLGGKPVSYYDVDANNLLKSVGVTGKSPSDKNMGIFVLPVKNKDGSSATDPRYGYEVHEVILQENSKNKNYNPLKPALKIF